MKIKGNSLSKRLKASLSRSRGESSTGTEVISNTLEENTVGEDLEESTRPATPPIVGLETEQEVSQAPLQAEALKALCRRYGIYPVPETARRTDYTSKHVLFEETVDPDGGIHTHQVFHGHLYTYNENQAYSQDFHDYIVEKNGTDRPTICRTLGDYTEYYRLGTEVEDPKRVFISHFASFTRPANNHEGNWEEIAKTRLPMTPLVASQSTFLYEHPRKLPETKEVLNKYRENIPYSDDV